MPNVLQLPYHLSWGALLLSIIILTNLSECLSIFTSLEWLNTAWVTRANLLLATVVSLLTFLAIHTFLLLSKHLKGRYFMFEIVLLIVFTIMSLTTNAIFTFTVYFGLWHSYRSLILEYNTIKVKATYGLSAFLKDVSPYSILGTAFLLLAYGLSSYFDLGISFYMIFIIIISTLTVPHLIVMHNLYTR